MKFILKKSGELVPVTACKESFLILAIFEAETPDEICKMFQEARLLIQQEINDYAIANEKPLFIVKWDYLSEEGKQKLIQDYVDRNINHHEYFNENEREALGEKTENELIQNFPVEVF